MKLYGIYPDSNKNRMPVGYVELNDDLPEEVINGCALIPVLRKKENKLEAKWEVELFGLIERTKVDTQPGDTL